MRPDPGPEFHQLWDWNKKVRPLVMPREGIACDLSPFVAETGNLEGFRPEKVTQP